MSYKIPKLLSINQFGIRIITFFFHFHPFTHTQIKSCVLHTTQSQAIFLIRFFKVSLFVVMLSKPIMQTGVLEKFPLQPQRTISQLCYNIRNFITLIFFKIAKGPAKSIVLLQRFKREFPIFSV